MRRCRPGVRFKSVFVCIVLMGVFQKNAMSLCLDGRRPSVDKEYSSSRFVVEGIVTSAEDIKPQDDPGGVEATQYSIKILQKLKGNAPHQLIIRSENTSSRFYMNINTAYLIFIDLYKNHYFVD